MSNNANFLKKGEVLAFKTDTVWGFGAHPQDHAAISRIYEIKKRDKNKPLILMSNNFEHLKKYIEYIPSYAQELINKHLPGGLTLIFKKSKLCCDLISAGSDTIGIRIPNSQDFFDIVSKVEGRVLATTSCNESGCEPVRNYIQAYKLFSNCANVVKPIDDSENENIPSTVVLCKDDGIKVLRQGAVVL